jgi:hypothetical protein
MKSTDIEVEVSSLQQHGDALRNQLNVLIQRFQNELPSLAEPWIRREVIRRIEDHPETVAALGAEKLKSLKGKVNSLIESLPDIVKKETSDSEDWPHNRAPESSGYGRSENEPFFNKAFRNVISNMGVVLDEFGLLTEPKGYVSSWERTGAGGFRFAINPGLDFLSIPILIEFGQLYKQYRVVAENLEKKQKELAKAKAREMWESA